MKEIKIKLNGKEQELFQSSTIQDMLEEVSVPNSMFVIEKNGIIISKENYTSTILENGDIIEVVSFFGGG